MAVNVAQHFGEKRPADTLTPCLRHNSHSPQIVAPRVVAGSEGADRGASRDGQPYRARRHAAGDSSGIQDCRLEACDRVLITKWVEGSEEDSVHRSGLARSRQSHDSRLMIHKILTATMRE